MIPDRPSLHYDRLGVPIDLDEWARLQADLEYKVIAHDTVGELWVSTTWLGLNHEFLGGPPLIFETMVFQNKLKVGEVFGHKYSYLPALDELTERYSTEAQAREGHERIVALVREMESLLADRSPESPTPDKNDDGPRNP